MPTSRRLAAVCIGANALTAGSIFCWPVFGPRIREDLGLSLTETNAIWSAAVVGQYASSAFMGAIGDTYGPRPLSLLAALLFGGGYFLMAQTERGATQSLDVSTKSHSTAFVAMAAFFVLVGAGVAASLFAALRSSSAHFKSHPGLALSIPLTLFSMSSLFLSSIASLSYFANPNTGDLDSPRWLASLGAFLMVINLFSAYGLSLPLEEEEVATSSTQDETTPLLRSTNAEQQVVLLAFTTPPEHVQASPPLLGTSPPLLTLLEFIRTPSAWILGFSLFAAVGGSEMVMSSIGSMVFSLQSGSIAELDDEEVGRDTLLIRTRQVQLIAIANTAARLSVGLLSDFVSPAKTERQQNGTWKRRLESIRISRVTFLLFGLALLGITFFVTTFAITRIDQLWIVSIATGLGYGLIFTLVPTLIMRAWPRQFGRNFGILNYMAALGSLCFSMLFAFVNDYVAVHGSLLLQKLKIDENVTMAITCRLGRRCFAPSFLIAAVALLAAFFVTLPLWRAWRQFV